MMRRIVYTQENGKLAVLSPSEGARKALSVKTREGRVSERLVGGKQQPTSVSQLVREWPLLGASAVWAETEDAFIARIIAKDVPNSAVDVHVVSEEEIPTDRSFRDAWAVGPSGVLVASGGR